MEISNFKLESEGYEKIIYILSSIQARLKVGSTFLINRNGQLICQYGDSGGIDVQSLSSLAASNLAATFGLGSLIGEENFERILHKGESRSILIIPVGPHALLLMLVPPDFENHLDSKSLLQASLILDDILRKCKKRTVVAGQ